MEDQLIPFRLNNVAYNVLQLYDYEETDTTIALHTNPGRRESSERIVSAIEIILPRIGET